jgi:hypothetical protein
VAFYNRLLAQPVQKFIDLLGKVEPIDVVSYGGLQAAAGGIFTGSNTVLLPAPSAGFAYRLHSWGMALSALAANGAAAINDGAQQVDATGHTSTNGLAGFGRPLFGHLSESAVSVSNFTGVTATFLVRYDLVIAPLIQ